MRKRKDVPRVEFALIWWLDAQAAVGWSGRDELKHDGVAVAALGIVVKRTDERIYLAVGWDPENDHFNGVMSIPKSWVLKEVALGELSADLSAGLPGLKCRRPKKTSP